MNQKPVYDFNSSFFKKNPFYKRLAKDHLSMFELDSDVIEWEVVETRSPMKIPCEYHIHFLFKSIVSINPDQTPNFGFRHTAKVTFPPRYPIEAPELYMQTDVWHPNVKSDGKYKGRICGNTKGFGLGFDLYLLIIRIGEILQYKQYHAENTPPFPEDIHSARWVMEYAEPHGIVNKYKGLVVDNTPLIKGGEVDGETFTVSAADMPKMEVKEPKTVEKIEMTFGQKPVPTEMSSNQEESNMDEAEQTSNDGKLKISILKKKIAGPKKIVINKK